MPAPAERASAQRAPDADVKTLEAPSDVQGDPVLPGFSLDLDPIWNPDL